MTEKTPTPAGPATGDVTAPSAAPTLTIRYNLIEDRLRLQLDEADGRFFLFDLSRRMTGILIDGLAKLLEKSDPTLAQTPADMRHDVMGMTHQASASGARAKENAPERTVEDLAGSGEDAENGDETEDDPGDTLPKTQTREVPPIVTAIHFVKQENGDHHMVLEDQSNKTLAVRTTNIMLHGILDLLIGQAKKGGWGLNTSHIWTSATGAPSHGQPQRYS